MQSQQDTFDLIVIGAGAAGSNVANGAIDRGYSVALIEKHKVGGTCLNIGCDPTKTLVRSAEVAHLARTAARFGIAVTDVSVDWPAIRRRIDGVIDAIRGGDGDRNIRDRGITLIKEHARFIGPSDVLAGGHRLTAERFLIATGATNTVPPIDGLDTVPFRTCDDILEMERLPDRMLIVGSGVIGVEYAQIFQRLGVAVTIVGTGEQLLPREDRALADALLAVFQREGVTWVPNSRVTGVTRAAGGITVTCEPTEGDAFDLETDELVLAVGREPNLEGLGLKDAGIATSPRGISIDATLRTTNPLVYAVGDATGIYPYTHVADYQGRIAEHNLFTDGVQRKADYRVVPWVTFSDPELARVGLTLEEAKAGGYDAVSATVPFADLPRAMTMDERHGMVTLVVDRRDRQVLGGHILGSRAGELISPVALVMERQLTVDAIVGTIHPYPTMSEAVFWAAYRIVNEALAEDD